RISHDIRKVRISGSSRFSRLSKKIAAHQNKARPQTSPVHPFTRSPVHPPPCPACQTRDVSEIRTKSAPANFRKTSGFVPFTWFVYRSTNSANWHFGGRHTASACYLRKSHARTTREIQENAGFVIGRPSLAYPFRIPH